MENPRVETSNWTVSPFPSRSSNLSFRLLDFPMQDLPILNFFFSLPSRFILPFPYQTLQRFPT